MCFGITWYPLRTLTNEASAINAASQTMSAPEFPSPTTRTRRPRNSMGSR